MALLELDDVTVRYGGLTAVAGVSLSLDPGEVRAIIGPNGAGKTTLFNAITGHAMLAAGSIRFRAERIDGLAPYLVHVAMAGPTTVWRGMLIDPLIHLRAARHLQVPPDPNHLVGVARVIAAFDPSWPFPRFSPSQQLFVWFILLALLAIALLAFSIWLVRDEPRAFRPRVLLAGTLFGLGIFPQAIQRADSAHLAWVSGTVVAGNCTTKSKSCVVRGMPQ